MPKQPFGNQDNWTPRNSDATEQERFLSQRFRNRLNRLGVKNKIVNQGQSKTLAVNLTGQPTQGIEGGFSHTLHVNHNCDVTLANFGGEDIAMLDHFQIDGTDGGVATVPDAAETTMLKREDAASIEHQRDLVISELLKVAGVNRLTEEQYERYTRLKESLDSYHPEQVMSFEEVFRKLDSIYDIPLQEIENGKHIIFESHVFATRPVWDADAERYVHADYKLGYGKTADGERFISKHLYVDANNTDYPVEAHAERVTEIQKQDDAWYNLAESITRSNYYKQWGMYLAHALETGQDYLSKFEHEFMLPRNTVAVMDVYVGHMEEADEE